MHFARPLFALTVCGVVSCTSSKTEKQTGTEIVAAINAPDTTGVIGIGALGGSKGLTSSLAGDDLITALNTGHTLINPNLLPAPQGADAGTTASRCSENSRVFDVTCFGALGDGTTNDTDAIQQALTAAVAKNGATLFFPPGSYKVTATLTAGKASNLDIVGQGRSTTILWSANVDLFHFTGQFGRSTVRHLTITPRLALTATKVGFLFSAGATSSVFDDVVFQNSGFDMASGYWLGDPADTVTFRDCTMWSVRGSGITIDRGSEVRVLGGRIIGATATTLTDSSIGIHLLGNNGGVHIQNVDVIGLHTGVLTENASGKGSNRELFIGHSSFDGCWRGIDIEDSTYVDITGIWAASAMAENVYVGFGAPQLVINGGTIFNAGAIATPDAANGANGMTVNSGTFILSGVAIRNNSNANNPHGRGLWVPNGSVANFTVSGCRFTDNGYGVDVSQNAGPGIFLGNVFAHNTIGNNFGAAQNLQQANLMR